MFLSQTTGWVDDVPVQVTCDVGYVLNVGVLYKNISCVFVNDNPVWNDTVGQCIRKWHYYVKRTHIQTSTIDVVLPNLCCHFARALLTTGEVQTLHVHVFVTTYVSPDNLDDILHSNMTTHLLPIHI